MYYTQQIGLSALDNQCCLEQDLQLSPMIKTYAREGGIRSSSAAVFSPLSQVFSVLDILFVSRSGMNKQDKYAG